MQKTKLELLAPAKNLENGIAAINCGADALYIGANSFGARAAAGNSISDIEKLIHYAHKFNVKVYSTVNTIFTDSQTEEIRKTLLSLFEIGIDAYIIQDLGILQLDIPKLPIFASTQTDNYNIERIKFLDSLGFKRIILARELSIEQIKQIKKEVKADLEFFVYGALCVSFSGRCYMSYAQKGRSANRGECAQQCRLKYDLFDSNKKYLFRNKYLLSLKDLDLSSYLSGLIEAGITSFKIEGRLKDINFVKNVTGYFRKKIDEILEDRIDFEKSSKGSITLGFDPNLDKTFNRGKTSYFINGRQSDLISFHSPKSIGEEIGFVKKTENNKIQIEIKNQTINLVNGDGLCYFDKNFELKGFFVNSVNGNFITSNQNVEIKPNTNLFRNQDQQFENILKSVRTERKLPLKLQISIDSKSLKIKMNNDFLKSYNIDENSTNNQANLIENIKKQFAKTGNTIFEIEEIIFDKIENPSFISISKLNEIRRDFLESFEKYISENYQREFIDRPLSIPKYFDMEGDYQLNIANKHSRELYQLSGISKIEDAFELQNNFDGKIVMTTKHCLKFQSGICPIHQKVDKTIIEPLWLYGDGHKYKLEFDCKNCEMKIRY